MYHESGLPFEKIKDCHITGYILKKSLSLYFMNVSLLNLGQEFMLYNCHHNTFQPKAYYFCSIFNIHSSKNSLSQVFQVYDRNSQGKKSHFSLAYFQLIIPHNRKDQTKTTTGNKKENICESQNSQGVQFWQHFATMSEQQISCYKSVLLHENINVI